MLGSEGKPPAAVMMPQINHDTTIAKMIGNNLKKRVAANIATTLIFAVSRKWNLDVAQVLRKQSY